jgi:hypothetical protein
MSLLRKHTLNEMGSDHNGAYGSGLGLEQERGLADVEGGGDLKRERERE